MFEAFRTAARPHDVVAQRVYDLLELGVRHRWTAVARAGVLEQLDSRVAPAVLSQYDAMPQLLDAVFASGVGGQDDEDGLG